MMGKPVSASQRKTAARPVRILRILINERTANLPDSRLFRGLTERGSCAKCNE